MKPSALLGSLVLCSLAVAHTVACRAPADDDAGGGDEAIIGGVDAKSAALDAIGALAYDNPQTHGRDLLCTATLIAPDAILTAKHCAVEKDEVPVDGGPPHVVTTRFLDAVKLSFVVGSDLNAPKRVVPITSVETCGVEDGGYMKLGCDMAVYRLAQPIVDVKPLAVAPSGPADESVGKRFTMVGFGEQTQSSTTHVYGTRKMGTVTMRAVKGSPLASLYPTFDAFLAALRANEGDEYVAANGESYRSLYEDSLLDGYEVFVGGGADEAQACHGDSGGPLLRNVNGQLVVQGVASGVTVGARLPCQMGVVYATFGAKAQELVTHAKDACNGVPAEGRCEGDVAVRCTNADEGPAHVTRIDCAEALQHCVPPAPGGDGGAGAAVVSCGDGPNANSCPPPGNVTAADAEAALGGPWKAPAAPQNVCTQANLDALKALFAANPSVQFADVKKALGATCAACAFTPAAAAAWGPLVDFGNGVYTNYGACFATVSNSSACGRDLTYLDMCLAGACSPAACGSDAATQACNKKAAAGGCATFEQGIAASCGDVNAGSAKCGNLFQLLAVSCGGGPNSTLNTNP